jgi:hypothetical protein
MGLVLAFDAAPRPASRLPASRREPERTADILFFTGVRYERRDGPEPSSPAVSPEQTAPASPLQ